MDDVAIDRLLRTIQEYEPELLHWSQPLRENLRSINYWKDWVTYLLEAENIEQFGGKILMTVCRHIVDCNLQGWATFIHVAVVTRNNCGHGFVHESTKFGLCRQLVGNFINEVNVNVSNTQGDTPMHFAARGGHLTDLNFLAENNAAFTANCDGYTPLHMAVMSIQPQIEIIRKLVVMAKGCNLLNAQTTADGNTALHLAVGNVFMTSQVIVELKAIKSLISNSQSNTAFDLAAKSKNAKLLLWLLQSFSPRNNIESVIPTAPPFRDTG